MKVDVSVVGGSGPRARTRRAILDAAVELLTADPTASLADIATAAGVGRTTVHRYFPERADLLTALGQLATERIDEATGRARPEHGTAAEALDRLCQELFELGKILMLVVNDPAQPDNQAWEQECTPADMALTALVERGHEDGSIDPRMNPVWVQNLLWALLYSTWQSTQIKTLSRHQALDLCLYTLRKAVAP